jgi:4a-hydroxytetrahydrobiopterin dehydratase
MIQWVTKSNALEIDLRFKDFVECWSFASKVALLAEKHNHHPELVIGYNYIKIRLSTHDAGNTITDKDHLLAHSISGLLPPSP